MKYFITSHVLCVLAMAVAFWWGGWPAVVICFLLTLMEVSFSFDNAVVNAKVLQGMDRIWQQRFLTWGMLIAVFGMRLLFPILIVALATGLGLVEVTQLALKDPDQYSAHVLGSHVQIGAFGGMFLLMVFLHFIFDEGKDVHWIHVIESKLSYFGKLEAVEVIFALSLLLIVQSFLHEHEQLHAMIAGVVGIVLYVLVHGITAILGGDGEHAGMQVAKSGLGGFIYLQVLDSSFSLDGVIGAFAISKDIVIIMLGLGVGAMYVRSLTIYLVHHDTLTKYLYLEHGAHYGIGILAVIMLVSMAVHVPEVITGVVGLLFIVLSLVSSVKHNRKILTTQGK